MPTPSPRLGLLEPSTSDPFSTQDIATNWGILDKYPGIYVCTSQTRPQWGQAQAGMRISETDTGLEWRWDGANFQRTAPQGLLRTTTGGWARGQRTSDFSTSSTSYVVVVAITNVVVPPGNRTLQINVGFYRAEAGGAGSYFLGCVKRSASNNSGTEEFNFACPDNVPGGRVGYVPGGLPAGTYSWSFQIAKWGNPTTLIRGSATTPIEIAVLEI